MGGGAEERYDVLSSRGTEAEPASCQIRRTVVLLSRAGYAGYVVKTLSESTAWRRFKA